MTWWSSTWPRTPNSCCEGEERGENIIVPWAFKAVLRSWPCVSAGQRRWWRNCWPTGCPSVSTRSSGSVRAGREFSVQIVGEKFVGIFRLTARFYAVQTTNFRPVVFLQRKNKNNILQKWENHQLLCFCAGLLHLWKQFELIELIWSCQKLLFIVVDLVEIVSLLWRPCRPDDLARHSWTLERPTRFILITFKFLVIKKRQGVSLWPAGCYPGGQTGWFILWSKKFDL